jgi:hypothetical protein
MLAGKAQGSLDNIARGCLIPTRERALTYFAYLIGESKKANSLVRPGGDDERICHTSSHLSRRRFRDSSIRVN